MQAQANRTETKAISSTQSLAAVQTLIKAGLGCITYMRDLLPQDNFTESHFTTSDDSLMSESQAPASKSTFTSPVTGKKTVNGFKIMTMTRGYTDEADRILNYLEYGIFDALQKQYLKSFVFAIYLDSKDPNNIVEAYTFNFQYHTIPGTDMIIPVMSLGDDLKRMSLQGNDPVVEAAKRGTVPTLKDVKRSVKTLLKTLISSMHQMDVLPKRRYATFKVFYTDDTPSEYEPPHFKPGDYERDKWYFSTHETHEVPDTWNLGNLNAGWHEVDVSAIPPPALTPAEEIAHRTEEIKKHALDAETRRVIWAAESEPRAEDETHANSTKSDYLDIRKPIGIREDDGTIRPLPSKDAEEALEERHFFGVSQHVPRGLRDIQNPNDCRPVSDFPQTQIVNDSDVDESEFGEAWQQIPGRELRRQVSDTFSMRGSSSGDRRMVSVEMKAPDEEAKERETDELMKKLALSHDGGVDAIEDEEMLDLETQIVDSINLPLTRTPTLNSPDPIQSFDSNKAPSPARINEMAVSSPVAPSPAPAPKTRGDEEVVECECGIQEEDESCACEGGCGKWYHIWCMGYHSATDQRLPQNFICFDCRVRADPSWELIKVELYSTLIVKFRELASFRRAIKIAEKNSPLTAVEFAKAMGCENTQARQLMKRLETEGFISEETTITDELGLMQTQTRSKSVKGKGKGKAKTKPRRGLKQKFVFNWRSIRTQEYKDYFDPSDEVQNRLLGIPQTRASLKARKAAPMLPPSLPPSDPPQPSPEPFPQTQSAQTQSQTQDDPEFFAMNLKRPADTGDSPRPRKKVKISIAHGVDLAE
ncbi:DNA-binding protein [Gymnopus androsaceus JB14]|uniref:DNA-binding protein n=1 Tax=Gymnopus androsaceus JB14 TaxID=1447944 RepID=A0A6A4HLK3_9AGAR|nr:DNA-binding protein [Gymnopus androsaceus JB14]